jgi:flavin-dependent thymidylate synthase
MTVELLSCTPNALNLLLATKGVRLSSLDDPASWDEAKKLEHLAYMRDTIKSSWEFVDYTFKISGVTRAFTHQLVRTRTGSYAQQAQRVVDVRDQPVECPPNIAGNADAREIWTGAEECVIDAYSDLLDRGIAPQDARGILPTNMTTTIIAKYNLRSLHDMALVRLCTRTQGEYQSVFKAMKQKVVEAHPWADDFICVHCVEYGTCAFPRYGKVECPVYFCGMDNTAVKSAAKNRWESCEYEASPRAKNGMAQ